MSPPEALPLTPLRAAVRRRASPVSPAPDALEVALDVAGKGGPDVRAVVFFGSRKTQAGYDPWSAYDFFVVTRSYLGFYRSLRRAGALGRSPALVAALNAWLPPNQVSLSAPGETGNGPARRAKCAVVSLGAFLRETSDRRRDHFCAGRLFQPAEVLYAADDEVREQVLEGLAGACAATYSWVRPWLPGRFDVEAYCRTLLRVSLAREIRPEPEGRAEALFRAQRNEILPAYEALLEGLAAAGRLRVHEGGLYSLADPVRAPERLRLHAYFSWSLCRATARWLKYMITFEDWLEYIVHKAERHTGKPIELTTRERRLPLLFLWPRLIRFLRDKDRRGRAA